MIYILIYNNSFKKFAVQIFMEDYFFGVKIKPIRC